MDESVVDRLMILFRGLEGTSGTHGVPEKDPDGLKWNIKRTAKTVRVKVTRELWLQHLRGERPLGVTPIRSDNSCSWGSIDFDVYDADIAEILKTVTASRLPLVPCRSKSGGLHLFLFLKRAEPASDVQAALRDAAASLGMAECEIFPKQTQILEKRNDAGSWMVMPYFGGTFDGKLKLQHGLKKNGADMTVSEFALHCEKTATTVASFAALCEGRMSTESTVKTKKGEKPKTPSKSDFSDGPPCLQHLSSQGVQTDGRKRTLFMFALYYKRADPDGWRERLEAANQKFFAPPLPSREVAGVVSSVEKKEYEYTCKEEPMRSHCNSTLCRMRKFGVGRGGEYPVISGISKLLTEPPIWFVQVEDARLELTTEDLQNYARFHRACMEQVNKCFKPIRQDVWFSLVGEAMDKLELIEAPPDVGVSGQFHELLEEFLTNRARGSRREDLLSGRPWEDTENKYGHGRAHYFTLRALTRYLVQEGVRDMKRSKVTSYVEKMGGGAHFFNIENKKGVNVWFVPSTAVHATGSVEPPEIEENGE